MAMPETRIGFLPDVGATHFLNVMPVEVELYVGLTGVTLSGADALHFRLADLCVPADWLRSFEERLQRMPHDGNVMRALRRVLEPPCNIVPHTALASHKHWILRTFDRGSSIGRIVATLDSGLQRSADRELKQWFQATIDAMGAHSPTMLHVTREALLHGRQMSLAECFRMELGIVKRAIEEGDFCEGVRAHLVDKDRQPRWQPATISGVSPELVRHFMSSPWRGEDHPLADLGS
jgi:enoyl-CoA hydratase/carnithine racemase